MALSSSSRGWAMAAIAFLVGGVLLSLAVPRTIGAWAAIEGDAVFFRLGAATPPSGSELDAGAKAYRRANDWQLSGERFVRLGVIESMQAQALGITVATRSTLFEQSEQHIVEGLSRNSLNGYGWMALASVRQQRGAARREIAEAVMQSLDMSPLTQYLWLPRMKALFLYSTELNEDELRSVRGHLRLIWNANPSQRQPLLIVAFTSGNLWLLSTTLENDIEAKAEFDKLTLSTPLK